MSTNLWVGILKPRVRRGHLTRSRWFSRPSGGVEDRASGLRKLVSERLTGVPTLNEFMSATAASIDFDGDIVSNDDLLSIPQYLKYDPSEIGRGRRVYIENYGCQMNISDSQIVYRIMLSAGFELSKDVEEADVIFLNTCAIRDHAEQKIWSRLGELRMRGRRRDDLIVGVLGCMAERLKVRILEREKLVDIVAGPDSYRDLPFLVMRVDGGEKAIQVALSQYETYADIAPVRFDGKGISAFVSISRGCNHHCTYCIVPRVRGIERSRPLKSIEEEVRELSANGYKEVVLLGQNVNSYNDMSGFENPDKLPDIKLAKGFSTIYRTRKAGVTFSQLVDRISQIDPEMRIRFISPHPKDFPDELLHVIKDRPNVCKSLHIPAQAGNSVVLERMRRGYTREAYLELVDHIRDVIGPNVCLSSDFISGFCGETHEQHLDTITLIERVKFDQAFMFAYSMREKTPAHRKYVDDVPEDVKKMRLQQVIETFHKNLRIRNEQQIGEYQLVLVEDRSKKSEDEWMGRNDGNKKVLFTPRRVSTLKDYIDERRIQMEQLQCKKSCSFHNSKGECDVKFGDYVVVKITGIKGLGLAGELVAKTTLTEFSNFKSHLI